jgi:glutamine synthetase
LLIYAGLDGINNNLYLPPVADFDLFSADESVTKDFDTLPESLAQAKKLAAESGFVKALLPQRLIDIYCK